MLLVADFGSFYLMKDFPSPIPQCASVGVWLFYKDFLFAFLPFLRTSLFLMNPRFLLAVCRGKEEKHTNVVKRMPSESLALLTTLPEKYSFLIPSNTFRSYFTFNCYYKRIYTYN